jgi:pilus assembly protein CpaB
MNRRTRHIVVLAIAIVTASIASFGVFRAMGQLPAKQAERVQFVVLAARSMAIGTQLTEADVKVVAWPASSAVPGSISDVKNVVSRGLLAAVLENEPITSNKLASLESGAGLPPAIPPGMRAMSVKVNDVIGVAGYIVPGSRVDVVVTMRRERESMTRTAASNVQVLTAGTRKDQEKPVEEKEKERKSATGETVVTLMVSPRDAERIALAQNEGQIMLVLRNPLDTDTTVGDGVKTASLLGPAETPAPAATVKTTPAPRRAAAPKPAEPVAAPPAPPAPRTVEAIRAAKRTEEVIK